MLGWWGLLAGALAWPGLAGAGEPCPHVGRAVDGACAAPLAAESGGGGDDDASSALQYRSEHVAAAAAAAAAVGGAGAAAGAPGDTLAGDMLGVHDLLLFGFWGVMSEGPQVSKELERRKGEVIKEEAGKKNYTYMQTLYERFQEKTLAEDQAKAFPGLLQTQQAAVDLALLVQDLHPWATCREAFARNAEEWQRCKSTGHASSKWKTCDDEALVTAQAAEAWACVGVQEEMITVACNGEDKTCTGKPVTSLRDPDNPDAVKQVSPHEPYRNYVINGDAVKDSPLGVCWQGGPDKTGLATGKTKWLRACSYWTAFHSMALRADALGGDLPNQLFGAIIRLVAGGVLWCGG